jgi:hypothetical protein
LGIETAGKKEAERIPAWKMGERKEVMDKRK